jgi:hypothetical protein
MASPGGLCQILLREAQDSLDEDLTGIRVLRYEKRAYCRMRPGNGCRQRPMIRIHVGEKRTGGHSLIVEDDLAVLLRINA